jgi:hypothetical protein
MKLTKYTFNFKGGQISVMALNEIEGSILAQAEAIKRGWDYTIFAHPKSHGRRQIERTDLAFGRGLFYANASLLLINRILLLLACFISNNYEPTADTSRGVVSVK